MAMAVDSRQQQQGQMGGLGYDPMRYPAPQFTNPWASSPAPSGQLYPTSLTPAVSSVSSVSGLSTSSPAPTAAPTNVSMAPYAGLPVTSAPMGASDMMNPRSSFTAFTQSASPNISSYAPTSAPQQYASADYTAASKGSPYTYHQQLQQQEGRRSSFPSVPAAPIFGANGQKSRQDSLVDFSNRLQHQDSRGSFSDALDASRGMVAMSNDLTTPRNIYGNPSARNSTDSYGFPSTHSTHSSISSASTYPSYYSGSVTDSVTDYSSAGESVEPMASRTLPPPTAMVGTNLPPAPQSMMGQFSSKVSSSSQKKHKCKICDKRFTRPSSLQTHMYSHTGEKPFACEVTGCGRHFSVVSNLRRHRKVHKNEGDRDQPSPEEM